MPGAGRGSQRWGGCGRSPSFRLEDGGPGKNAHTALGEAGALAKRVGRDLACPYLFRLEPEDLTADSPLSALQVARADKKDTLKLLRTLNEALAASDALDPARLERTFEQWWPALEAKLEQIPPDADVTERPRSTDNKIGEILLTVRELARGNEQAVKAAAQAAALREWKGSNLARLAGLGRPRPMTIGDLAGWTGKFTTSPRATGSERFEDYVFDPTLERPVFQEEKDEQPPNDPKGGKKAR
jgi:hypothetical protein